MRNWAISATLACFMLAGTFVWAKDSQHNKPPRNPQPHPGAPYNQQHTSQPRNSQPNAPRLPNAGSNAAKPGRPNTVETPAHVNTSEPKIAEPKIAEPKIVEPKTSGAAGDSKAPHVNEPNASHGGEPRLGPGGEPGKPRPGEWLSRLKDMNLADQQKALNSDPEFQKLPPEQKQKLHERLQEFNNLRPEQKEQLIQRMKQWDKLSPQQQEQARGLQEKLRNVPDDRRKMMQTALRNLRQMDPEERERVLNSDRFKSMFNDNERDIIRGVADLPIGKGAQQQPNERQPDQPNSTAK